MKKLLGIVILGLLLSGCNESTSVNKTKYFKNCVKDAMKVKLVTEKVGVDICQGYVNYADSSETFNYYKGKVYSKPKQQ